MKRFIKENLIETINHTVPKLLKVEGESKAIIKTNSNRYEGQLFKSSLNIFLI